MSLASEPRAHILKTTPEFYKQISTGAKQFEIRKDDRDFLKGDVVVLAEWDPQVKAFTGQNCVFQIGYMLQDFPGLAPDYVAFMLVKQVNDVTIDY